MTAPAAEGGATTGAPAPTPNDAAAAAAAAAKVPAGGTDRGFPEGTPLEQMTAEQQVAYWKHHSRKHEDAAKAYKLTPQQVSELQARVEAMEADRLTADEKALRAAQKEAADAASAAAKAELLPQIQHLEVKAIVSTVLGEDKDRLTAFMEFADPSKLVGQDGHADEAKVMGLLTAMFGQQSRGPQLQQQPRWQNAGQYSPPAPPGPQPGAAGRAEAQKRSGKKTTTT